MRKKFRLTIGLLIFLIVISSCVGRYELSVTDIFEILKGNHESNMAVNLFYHIRLPRTILVVICGGALSLSGMIYQGLFKNPLVSPDILGVASGCSVGAILSIVFAINSMAMTQIITFGCGIFVVLTAIGIAKNVEGNKTVSIIIAGIIVNSLSTSAIMMLKYLADPNRQLAAIEFWLMGGFYNAGWKNIITILPLMAAVICLLYMMRWKLKICSLGEEEAQTLGIHVNRTRTIAIVCATILVSTVVSTAGIVSWIGLIAPHIVKIYACENIMENIPITLATGGVMLLFSDILSRTLFTAEIPISILTSLFGALFLLYLLLKRGIAK